MQERGDPSSAHACAVLEEPSCPRAVVPPGRVLPGKKGTYHPARVPFFCQTPHWQKSARTLRKFVFRCLQAVGCFGNIVKSQPGSVWFIFVVVFIRWPASLFPARLFHYLCGIMARQLRWTRTLSASLFTAAMLLLHLFYFPQWHRQSRRSQSMFPFSFSHSAWMCTMHPLRGTGKQCSISIGHNSALTVHCRAQPSSPANFIVIFSMCVGSLTLFSCLIWLIHWHQLLQMQDNVVRGRVSSKRPEMS